MKFEVIKQTVARGLYAEIVQCSRFDTMVVDLVGSDFEAAKGRHSHEVATAYAEKAVERVMNWDVRSVTKLRELFPRHFPPSLLNGKLVCFMADNENCDWMVEKELS